MFIPNVKANLTYSLCARMLYVPLCTDGVLNCRRNYVEAASDVREADAEYEAGNAGALSGRLASSSRRTYGNFPVRILQQRSAFWGRLQAWEWPKRGGPRASPKTVIKYINVGARKAVSRAVPTAASSCHRCWRRLRGWHKSLPFASAQTIYSFRAQPSRKPSAG